MDLFSEMLYVAKSYKEMNKYEKSISPAEYGMAKLNQRKKKKKRGRKCTIQK